MGPHDFLKYANRCIEIADEFSDETMKLTLLRQAKAWLQAADELDRNDAFMKCVKDVEMSEPTVE